MRAASTPRVPASSSLHACSAHSRKQIFPEPSTWAIVRTIIGSRQWHKGAAGRSFIMKFAQVRALIQIMKVRSPDRMSPTNRLVNHAFRVAVDVRKLERKCKTIGIGFGGGGLPYLRSRLPVLAGFPQTKTVIATNLLSASRLTAGAAGFLILTHSRERPER